MSSGHVVAKTVRQWGLLMALGVAGFAVGIAGFLLLGVDGICSALNALPAVAVGIALSALLALALLSIGALLALAQERWRNLLARIALNNMTQGLCMFDSAARLVLCNVRYIDMHLLRREQLQAGMPLREMLVLRAEKGTFSGDPDRLRRRRASRRWPKAALKSEPSSSATDASSLWSRSRWRTAAG